MAFLRMGLQQKIVLLAVVCFLIVAGALGFFGLEAVRQSTDRALEDRLGAAERIASDLDMRLLQLQDSLDGSSRAAFGYLRETPQPDRDIMDGFYEWLRPFVVHVHLLDQQGNLIWQTPSEPATDPNHSALVQTGPEGFHVVEPTQPGKATHQVALIAAIKDKGGNVMGFVDAAMDLGWLVSPQLFDRQGLGKLGYIQVFSKAGDIVASSQAVLREEETIHKQRFASLIDQGRPVVTTCHRCHQTGGSVSRSKEVVAFAPMGSMPWGVAFRQPEGEVFLVSRDLQKRLLFFALPALAGVFSIALFASRGILRPVKNLTGAAKLIAGGNLNEPLPLHGGKDEIGLLGRTFEDMRVGLKASQEEIEAKNREIEGWNRELEGKVEERTRELRALFEVSKTLASSPDLDSVLPPALQQVLDWCEKSEGVALFLRQKSSDRLIPAAYIFSGHTKSVDLEGLATEATDAFYTMAPQSLSLQEEIVKAAGAGGRGVVRNNAFIPCVSNENRSGMLVVLGGPGQESFSPTDLVGLQAFADLMAVAIEKHRLALQAGQAEALRQADALKSEFMSIVSHELRTPLASIKGFASTLLQDDVRWDAEAQRDFVATINQEADRLTHMVNELLDMSRIEGGALRMEKEWCRFSEIVEDVTDRLDNHTRNHKMEVRLQDPALTVFVDGPRLEQVLTNLITNAVNFSPNGGDIGIEAEARPGCLLVSVSDQGVGIPAEHLEKIFDRFHRVGDGRRGRTGGVGLGLSICRGIVEAHGGKIWAESTSGQGSRFYFTIPN